MKTTKWAVVGPGFIAGRFAQGMLEAPGAERTAVVSRSEQNGRAYAENTALLLLIPILKKCSGSPSLTWCISPRRTTPIWIMCPRP